MINLFLPDNKRHTEDVGAFAVTSVYGPLADFWYSTVGRPTASKVRVTQEIALSYSAVWAATRLLSGTIGSLPLNLYRMDPYGDDTIDDESTFVLRDDNRNRMVEHRPNDEMNSMMFRTQAAVQQINGGNCYSEIEGDVEFERTQGESGQRIALWPIHNSRVTLIRDERSDEILYKIKNHDAEPTYLKPFQVLHIPSMMSDNGLSGKGVITYARESVGFGLATERYGAAWFGSGGIPRVVVTTPSKLNDDSRRNFRKEWKEIYAGSDSDRVALLGEGAKLEPININNDDSQFLETRKHNIEEIARWYGIPPHMLQHLADSNYSTVEQLAIEFVQHGLIPWLRLWEQELWAKLLTPEEQIDHFFRFNVNELLRGDSKSRAEYLRTLIQIGVLTPDEGRIMEGRNPKGGVSADQYMQGAMVKIGTAPANAPAPPTAESQDGKDTQNLVLARMMVEQSQGMETRLAASIAKSMEGIRSQFEFRLGEIVSHEPQKKALLAAARLMLVDAAGRMIRYEGRAAREAAKKPAAFLGWLDKFYGEFSSKCEEAYRPICAALVTLGVSADSRAIADLGAAESRDALLTLSGSCSAAELADKVEGLVSEWEKTGAQSIADSVIGGQAA